MGGIENANGRVVVTLQGFVVIRNLNAKILYLESN